MSKTTATPTVKMSKTTIKAPKLPTATKTPPLKFPKGKVAADKAVKPNSGGLAGYVSTKKYGASNMANQAANYN